MRKYNKNSTKPEKPVQAGLLRKIVNPTSQTQVQASVILLLTILALMAGFAGKIGEAARSGLIKDEAVVSTPESVAAITNMVEEECRQSPGSKPSVYSGQENEAVLAAACNHAGGPAR
jgi:hypothetical protein